MTCHTISWHFPQANQASFPKMPSIELSKTSNVTTIVFLLQNFEPPLTCLTETGQGRSHRRSLGRWCDLSATIQQARSSGTWSTTTMLMVRRNFVNTLNILECVCCMRNSADSVMDRRKNTPNVLKMQSKTQVDLTSRHDVPPSNGLQAFFHLFVCFIKIKRDNSLVQLEVTAALQRLARTRSLCVPLHPITWLKGFPYIILWRFQIDVIQD